MIADREYRFLAAGEWADLFPGLQVRMGRAMFAAVNPDGEPTGVELEFRRSPADPFADKAAQRGG